jgi:hypothetical protein
MHVKLAMSSASGAIRMILYNVHSRAVSGYTRLWSENLINRVRKTEFRKPSWMVAVLRSVQISPYEFGLMSSPRRLMRKRNQIVQIVL